MKIKRKQQADFRTEKYTRFGIRKYSFGAASVAIATGLMFLGSVLFQLMSSLHKLLETKLLLKKMNLIYLKKIRNLNQPMKHLQ